MPDDPFLDELLDDDACDDGDDYFDCGRTHDGGCTKAGTEECDWECPYSDEDEDTLQSGTVSTPPGVPSPSPDR